MIITGRSLFFFTVFAITLFSTKNGKDMFSPIRLYLFAYSITLGITCLDLSPYSKGWHSMTWQVLFLSTLAYVMGVLSIYFISWKDPNRPFKELSEIKKIIRSKAYLPNKSIFLIGVVVCFFIYALVYLFGIHSVGTIPVFASEPDEARKKFAFFSSAANFLSLSEVVFFLSISMIMSGYKKFRVVYIVLAVLSISTLSLLLSRITIINTIFVSIVFYRYFVGPFKWKFILLIISLFIVVVFGVFILRTKGDYFKKDIYKQFTNLKVKKGYELSALPYAYIANNYWNLNFGIEEASKGNIKHVYGLRTFHALFQAVRQSKTVLKAFGDSDFLDLETQKVDGFNTITYHWNLYKDFGFVGVILGSFFMGIAMALVYSLLRSKPNWYYLYLYGNMTFWIALSFFAPLWYHLTVFIQIGSGFIILKIATNVEIKESTVGR